MTKTIAYTTHALTAMRERDLPQAGVERAVYDSLWIEPDPRDPQAVRHFCAIAEREGRYLRVALVESAENFRILTAFLDRGARPK